MDEKKKLIEEIVTIVEQLPPEGQQAAMWMMKHFELAVELCRAPISPEIREELRVDARKKKDYLLLLLVELESILHEEGT